MNKRPNSRVPSPNCEWAFGHFELVIISCVQCQIAKVACQEP